MWSGKSKEVPLPNPRNLHNKETVRDTMTSWDTLSQTKAALRHIENKLEVTPTSTAVFDSIMDTKKSSANATRKISRKDGRYLEDCLGIAPSNKISKSRKEKSSRSPLRATTLESNVKKNNHVEFREPLASFRGETFIAPSTLSSSQPDVKHLYGLDPTTIEETIVGGSRMIYNRDDRDIHCQDFDSSQSSVVNETVVRYLNDRPAIDALQNSETLFRVIAPVRNEEEKTSGAKVNEKTSVSNISRDVDMKVSRPSESSPSSNSTTSAQRLDILKRRQHDSKLEKLKERIRKQWENSEDVSGRGQHLGHVDQPVMITSIDNGVTAKVRKVAIAPPAPAYKGFNPAETKIRTPDGKVWPEAVFHNMSRDLYRDLGLYFGGDVSVKEKPPEKSKEKKAVRPVRKVQKITQTSSPDCKSGGGRMISTSSWRDGQKLVKKILGPAPRIEQRDRRTESSDRNGKEKTTKSVGQIGRAESDPRLDVSHKRRHPRSTERSRSRVRPENNLKKLPASLPDSKPVEDTLNKDFLPVEIRGILDDLQLDSAPQVTKQEAGDRQNQKSVVPSQSSRSHSPVKRKPDKLTANEDPPVISKKRHYDTDEVRQYIVRQQEERKRRQNEEKKAQKEATEQKNKRLQELYRKQKEAFSKGKNVPSSEPSAARRLQETYSKLLLEQALLEEPSHQLHVTQEQQVRPGYQPSGESDKENKVQERPPSASSSSDMSLSEPLQPLARSDLVEPSWMQPDRLSPRTYPSQQPLIEATGCLLSQLLDLEHVGTLQKDFESVLSARRNQVVGTGQWTLTPQLYVTSTATQQDALIKPSPNQYRSKLDRIEALKATAASLSSRIESEAKKLAGANINYGTTWNHDYDVQQGPQEDGHWAKPLSPPVREDNEDTFSARIQKMLGTCVSHTGFDDNLPGVGNLSEFKKLPEMIRPHSSVSNFGLRSPHKPEGILAQLSKRQTDSPASDTQVFGQDKIKISHDSSTDSVSEGPLLSEGSLSEEEEGKDGHSPLKAVTEILKEKEFCAGEKNAYEPIKEFQKDAEKFSPLFGQAGGTQSKGSWEELAKGSPHSVINIFAKSYQLYGKGFEDMLDKGPPVLRPLLPITTPAGSVSYEDDFVSSPANGTLSEKKSAYEPIISSSSSSIQEESSSRKSQHSAGTQSVTSSRSSTSSKGKKGRKEKKEWSASFTGGTQNILCEEERSHSNSDRGSHKGKKPVINSKISINDYEQYPDTDSTLENLSGQSMSLSSDKGRSQRTPTSPLSPSSQKLPQFDLPANSVERTRSPAVLPSTPPSGFKPNAAFSDINLAGSRATVGTPSTPGTMRFSPAGLQHRMTAELNYLSAIEESVRQLTDVERVRGISLAQQETVSLAQILKAQQQRHERDLVLLKLKAEHEALESQRQLEEARQKAAQAHAESLQQLVQSRQEATEALQETTCKIAAQQAEAARLTTDAARQIREMTELARNQISDAVTASAAPITVLIDHQRQQHSEFMKHLRARTDTDRKSESVVLSQSKEETSDSKNQKYSPYFDSYSEASKSKSHDQRSSNSHQESPSVLLSKENEKKSASEKIESPIEEQIHTAVDDSLQSDSIPSLPDEKDSTSVATEYSLKFDESMTEDEIEEKSFRSLLPSESHRRFNMEKKRGHRDDSDEEASPEKTALSPVKELSMPFSGGQDSFSKFTMEMVRQYMKEEEMRAAHQSSLLRLREKALKEKAKAELAWLEHQKKHLRDKGEDDKMPPLRKRQRGLLLKLQQEKAEIKRLQEANKAARKERQLILKQQEEIERIRQTTIKLQEKLKSAGENKLEPRSEDETKQSKASSPAPTDLETRSPSPVSISSSETSSIMQKLKKMRSRMDEKHCSPVHYFFSVFTSHHWASLSVCFPNLHPKFQLYIYNQLVRFLTKREQKLMQRRQHAEELLEWKRRLDAEEAEIRRMEKQALAAWDKELMKSKTPKKDLGDERREQKETASEEESPAPSCSNLNSESSIPEELGSPPAEPVASETIAQGQSGSPSHSILSEEMIYSQDLELSVASATKHSPSKSCASLSKHDSSKGSHRTGGQSRLSGKSHQLSQSWSDESLSMTQSEPTSDQSDIEGRIRALKDELRKRKSVVDQLKKEQKKRQKERLKAQEASLIKQLESYDEFIKKTEAELNRDLETSPTAKPQIKTPSSATERPKIKPPPLHRPEATKNWKSLTESERSRGSLESIAEHLDASASGSERALPEKSLSTSTKRPADLDIHVEQPLNTSPNLKISRRARAESGDYLENVPLSSSFRDPNTDRTSNVLDIRLEEYSHKSEIQEEVAEYAKPEEHEMEDTYSKLSGKSFALLNLDLEQGDSPEIISKKDLPLDSKNAPKDSHSPVTIEQLQKTEEMMKEVQKDRDDVEKDPNTKSEQATHRRKIAKEQGLSFSEQLSALREMSYSDDFEASSPKKETSAEGTPAELYKDDFELSSMLSPRKDSQSQREKLPLTKNSRSKTTSFGSDDEISECLSEKSLSISGSVHSGRLLELKSPTELMKSKERSDVENEPSITEAPSWASASIAEADELFNFHLGDRVLVSNVQPGTLRFKGLTEFAKGFWAGVELDKPEGNNNGTYDGITYFECKEKHGIFAPPQKISHIPENFDNFVGENEDAFSNEQYNQHQKQEQKDTESPESNRGKDSVGYFQEKSPVSIHIVETLVEKSSKTESISKVDHTQASSVATESIAQEQSLVDSLVSSTKDENAISLFVSGAIEKVTTFVLEDTLDIVLSEELKRQQEYWTQELPENKDNLSPQVLGKPSTPLLDLLTKEKNQLEAQLRSSLSVEEKSKKLETVSLLTDSLLKTFVKDTVDQLQQIKKVKNEKIQLSNQELQDDDQEIGVSKIPSSYHEEQLPSSLPSVFLKVEAEDEREEVSSPDMCPRPESPVFGASGQEELAKRLAELELSREFLSALGDDQDWFDEDFGLSSSHQVQQNKAEEQIVPPMAESKKVPPKPCETLLAVPHTAEEVELLVHAAAEELWKRKEMGHDLQSISIPTRLLGSACRGQDIESTSQRVYKQAVFDLTKEIFGEIFAEDPNLNQPIWMKPCRMNSSYFRRVKNPSDLDEIKNFIATEVLKLFSLKKEPNYKTDWQKMMKFGRKKRDRVDHILVQELHEEEAQWVNYDEDELCVKMQLADGIFETLIRDTIDVLNQINEKQGRMLLV
ncbi:centrosome-associated protein 350 isoform X2 [Monodelphis domestica]|uniref:centrosome-associated protein 350 isoform X2 n=1 Tax=Monodelphis domestica TaxID=13616 RepID=UPI0024E1BD1C|nr:centrosome-associated protein 350 isoform X2 [Monodelphis domestica]XP_056671580.1 centrosome-associated protein 350 isoform X2 [Monodelphis domestica]XP_056671581.1 centrosome-associated protein 350 isoform X2 [Monodelphis domestica]